MSVCKPRWSGWRSSSTIPATIPKELTAGSPSTADRDGGKPGGGRGTHVVSQGESLWQIAQEYSTSVTRLQQLNDLPQGQAIQPGQLLKLDDID